MDVLRNQHGETPEDEFERKFPNPVAYDADYFMIVVSDGPPNTSKIVQVILVDGNKEFGIQVLRVIARSEKYCRHYQVHLTDRRGWVVALLHMFKDGFRIDIAGEIEE